MNPYKEIGEEKLHQMIDIFYNYVKNDDRMNHLFPGDWAETARKQKQFQTQFLGGPNLYIEEHGHPMMKARHMPFVITEIERDAWLENISKAIDDVGLDANMKGYLMERYTMVAHHMQNSTVNE
ncbi:globin [Abyssicoccus albus]|uniref:Hemoglobin n=1 Tax=Abyssicoccus albus TaxID=1817405 RepID=A0A1Q1G2I4_9BACL|nr:globin [Abyssicoccus albus]AQL56571.1 globin [Abyssicoccus albus]RPF57616.1 hemoglobin [Abyssicoccus albus]